MGLIRGGSLSKTNAMCLIMFETCVCQCASLALCKKSRPTGVNVSGLEGRILLCVVSLVAYCYGILFTFLCRRDLANSFKLNQVFIIIF